MSWGKGQGLLQIITEKSLKCREMSGDLDEHVSVGAGKETKPQSEELDPESRLHTLKGMKNSELKYHKFRLRVFISSPL